MLTKAAKAVTTGMMVAVAVQCDGIDEIDVKGFLRLQKALGSNRSS